MSPLFEPLIAVARSPQADYLYDTMRIPSYVLLALSCIGASAFFMPARLPAAPSLPGAGRARHVLYMGRRAAKIAARKGKSDAIKTKIYASFGKKIIMAVKAGGPDPEANRALSVVIREAKASGVPNDNIQRAIARGSSANEADFKEAVYEAYGYGGVGLIINCLTDNTNRAKTEINNVIKRTDVKIASSGSVAFNFVKKGLVEVVGKLDEDQVLEAALEADVDDVDTKVNEAEGFTSILVDPTSLGALRDVLQSGPLQAEIRSTRLTSIPMNQVECNDEDYENNANVIEALEELDDVDAVVTDMAGWGDDDAEEE